jgi:hypothetical protein
LSDCMRSMFAYGVIRVPREVIDNIPHNASPAQLNELLRTRYAGEEWSIQLKSAAASVSPRAILVDEFIASGNTLVRLQRLCHAIGMTVERGLTLVDFGSRRPRASLSIMSLYSLPLSGQ